MAVGPIIQKIGIVLIFVVRVRNEDLLEKIHFKRDDPPELVDFIENVLQHKNDFKQIREAAESQILHQQITNKGHSTLEKHKKSHNNKFPLKTFFAREGKRLKQIFNGKNHKSQKRQLPNPYRPINDVYPYLNANEGWPIDKEDRIRRRAWLNLKARKRKHGHNIFENKYRRGIELNDYSTSNDIPNHNIKVYPRGRSGVHMVPGNKYDQKRQILQNYLIESDIPVVQKTSTSSEKPAHSMTKSYAKEQKGIRQDSSKRNVANNIENQLKNQERSDKDIFDDQRKKRSMTINIIDDNNMVRSMEHGNSPKSIVLSVGNDKLREPQSNRQRKFFFITFPKDQKPQSPKNGYDNHNSVEQMQIPLSQLKSGDQENKVQIFTFPQSQNRGGNKNDINQLAREQQRLMLQSVDQPTSAIEQQQLSTKPLDTSTVKNFAWFAIAKPAKLPALAAVGSAGTTPNAIYGFVINEPRDAIYDDYEEFISDVDNNGRINKRSKPALINNKYITSIKNADTAKISRNDYGNQQLPSEWAPPLNYNKKMIDMYRNYYPEALQDHYYYYDDNAWDDQRNFQGRKLLSTNDENSFKETEETDNNPYNYLYNPNMDYYNSGGDVRVKKSLTDLFGMSKDEDYSEDAVRGYSPASRTEKHDIAYDEIDVFSGMQSTSSKPKAYKHNSIETTSSKLIDIVADSDSFLDKDVTKRCDQNSHSKSSHSNTDEKETNKTKGKKPLQSLKLLISKNKITGSSRTDDHDESKENSGPHHSSKREAEENSERIDILSSANGEETNFNFPNSLENKPDDAYYFNTMRRKRSKLEEVPESYNIDEESVNFAHHPLQHKKLQMGKASSHNSKSYSHSGSNFVSDDVKLVEYPVKHTEVVFETDNNEVTPVEPLKDDRIYRFETDGYFLPRQDNLFNTINSNEESNSRPNINTCVGCGKEYNIPLPSNSDNTNRQNPKGQKPISSMKPFNMQIPQKSFDTPILNIDTIPNHQKVKPNQDIKTFEESLEMSMPSAPTNQEHKQDQNFRQFQNYQLHKSLKTYPFDVPNQQDLQINWNDNISNQGDVMQLPILSNKQHQPYNRILYPRDMENGFPHPQSSALRRIRTKPRNSLFINNHGKMKKREIGHVRMPNSFFGYFPRSDVVDVQGWNTLYEPPQKVYPRKSNDLVHKFDPYYERHKRKPYLAKDYFDFENRPQRMGYKRQYRYADSNEKRLKNRINNIYLPKVYSRKAGSKSCRHSFDGDCNCRKRKKTQPGLFAKESGLNPSFGMKSSVGSCNDEREPVKGSKDYEQIHKAVSGQLASDIVLAAFSRVKERSHLNARFGPGLFRDHGGRVELKSMSDFRTNETANDIKFTETMLHEIMKMLNKIILDQVHRRTCKHLSPVLKTYLADITKGTKKTEEEETKISEEGAPLPWVKTATGKPADVQQDDFLFYNPFNASSAGKHEKELQQKIAMIKKLLDKYRHLSKENRGKVEDIEVYLEQHLTLLESRLQELQANAPHHKRHKQTTILQKAKKDYKPSLTMDMNELDDLHQRIFGSKELTKKQSDTNKLDNSRQLVRNNLQNVKLNREPNHYVSKTYLNNVKSSQSHYNERENDKKRKTKRESGRTKKDRELISESYRKLAQSVESLRRKRENERRLGEMYGDEKRQLVKRKASKPVNKRNSVLSQISYETPLVYSL